VTSVSSVVVNRWCVLPIVAAAAAIGVVGCSSGSGSSGETASTVATVKPEPAGAEPSESARMLCAEEVRKDLETVLGVAPVLVTPPTWIDHRYACDYVYPNGTLSISVKELDNESQTRHYFDELGAQLDRRPRNLGLGQGAYKTANGSLVVRKDWKVLLVDVSKLPAQFGQPPVPRTETANKVGVTVMGCWTGA
jgi:hypothetical protein